MNRFVMRYTGQGVVPAPDLEAIHAQSGLTVLDRSPRMLLVEATPPVVDHLVGSLPGWVSTPERMAPLPDTRLKIHRSPD